MFCVNCGRELGDNHRYCSNCGVEVQTTGMVKPATVSLVPSVAYGFVSVEMDLQIKTNQAYYAPKFQRMRVQNQEASWNWAAFWLGPFWFFYRKMYGFGMALMSIQCLFSVAYVSFPLYVTPPLGSVQVIVPILAALVNIMTTIFANYIYMRWLEKRSEEMKFMCTADKIAFAKKRGGTDLTTTIIVCAAWYLLSYLISEM